MTASRSGWILGVGIAAYLLFHAFRTDLPLGPVRDALPSFLFLPVAFAAVDLVSVARSRLPWSTSLTTALSATLLALLVLEGLGPRVLGRGTSDPADAVALILGFALHRFLGRSCVDASCGKEG